MEIIGYIIDLITIMFYIIYILASPILIILAPIVLFIFLGQLSKKRKKKR